MASGLAVVMSYQASNDSTFEVLDPSSIVYAAGIQCPRPLSPYSRTYGYTGSGAYIPLYQLYRDIRGRAYIGPTPYIPVYAHIRVYGHIRVWAYMGIYGYIQGTGYIGKYRYIPYVA